MFPRPLAGSGAGGGFGDKDSADEIASDRSNEERDRRIVFHLRSGGHHSVEHVARELIESARERRWLLLHQREGGAPKRGLEENLIARGGSVHHPARREPRPKRPGKPE